MWKKNRSLRVSTFCGKDCPNEHPTAIRERVDESLRNVTSLKAGLAKYVAEAVECSQCLILTASDLNCDCYNAYHFFDIFCDMSSSTRELKKKQQTSIVHAQKGLFCGHCNNGFVQLALKQNQLVISNSVDDDPRFETKSSTSRPISHFPIRNVMVVPLMVPENVDKIMVGLVVCTNKIAVETMHDTESACRGFTVNDFECNEALFHHLALRIMCVHSTGRLVGLEATIESMQTIHQEELRKASVTKDMFIATMSHEIRTPLNAINGYNEIMLNSISKGDERLSSLDVWLRKQRAATLQLTQLIANILDFAKLKSASVKLDSRPFSVVELSLIHI